MKKHKLIIKKLKESHFIEESISYIYKCNDCGDTMALDCKGEKANKILFYYGWREFTITGKRGGYVCECCVPGLLYEVKELNESF